METSNVTYEQYDEADSELHRWTHQSGHECAGCAEELLLTDELYSITVVKPYVTTEGILYVPMEAQDGDFLYEPRFISVDCWESALEGLREQLEDVPPILDDFAILDCSICESGIRQEEASGLATFGEIHCSQRTPDGTATTVFESMDHNPDVVCISCLKKMNEEFVGLWDAEVQADDECDDGTHYRCWRYGCPGFEGCRKS